MIAVGRKNLLYEKTRLVLSVGGVAAAVALMLIINAFTAGLYEQATAYMDHLDAQVIVAQEGVENLQSSMSLLSGNLVGQVGQVPGVKSVAPIISLPLVLQRRGLKTAIQLIGYRPGSDGGPWSLAVGETPKRSNEAVLDQALARRENLAVGGEFMLQGRRLKVVGLSRETSSFMNPFVFMTLAGAGKFMEAPGFYSFLAVKGSYSPDRLKRQISDRFPGVNVVKKSRFQANELKLVKDAFSSIANLLVYVAYGIGALTVWLTLYTAIHERLGEYTLIRALGAGSLRLLRILFSQALTIGVLGGIFGWLMSSGISSAVEVLYPRFLLVTDSIAVRNAVLLLAIASVLAPFKPWRDILGGEPSTIFDQ